jgi:hypothetical protein
MKRRRDEWKNGRSVTQHNSPPGRGEGWVLVKTKVEAGSRVLGA